MSGQGGKAGASGLVRVANLRRAAGARAGEVHLVHRLGPILKQVLKQVPVDH